MSLDGVDPPLPRELVDAMTPYLSHRGAASIGWSPPSRPIPAPVSALTKGDGTDAASETDERNAPTLLVLTRFGESAQLHAVARPGGARRQLTFSREPVSWGAYSPRNTGGDSATDFLVFAADRGGDEFTQLYRLEIAPSPHAGRVTLLTGDGGEDGDGGQDDGETKGDGDKKVAVAVAPRRSRNTSFRFSRDGRFLAYFSTRRNGRDTDLWIVEPDRAHESQRSPQGLLRWPPAFDRLALQLEGGGWWVCDFSFDDRWLLIGRYVSVNETHLWRVDLAPLYQSDGGGQRSSPTGGGEGGVGGRDDVACLSLAKFPVTPVAVTATATAATTEIKTAISSLSSATLTSTPAPVADPSDSKKLAATAYVSPPEFFLPSHPSSLVGGETKSAKVGAPTATATATEPVDYGVAHFAPDGRVYATNVRGETKPIEAKTIPPTATETVYYGFARFAPDGRVYAATDRGSDFRRIVVLTPPPSTEKPGDAWHHDYPLPDLAWDISDIAISPDGALLAYTANEDGFSRLRVLRLPSHEPVALAADSSGAAPAAATATSGDGVITNLAWHPMRHTLAFSLSSARCSLDVYTVDIPAARRAASPRRAALLAVGLLRPEGCFSRRAASLAGSLVVADPLPLMDALGCHHAPKSTNLFAHLPALADVACVYCYYGASSGTQPATHCTECLTLTATAAAVVAAVATNTGASVAKSIETELLTETKRAFSNPTAIEPRVSAAAPVYSASPVTTVVGGHVRWTESETGGVDASRFSAPSILRIDSFDGLLVSGNLYRPDARRWPGKRPIVIAIHGGPESQARPSYQGSWNYFLEELGYILLFPNVRGSTGYGKRFVTLDDGMLRQDSVRDIGTFIDWTRRDFDEHMSTVAASGVDGKCDAKREAKSPEAASPPTVAYCDPDAVMLYGGSYGGYMVLAAMVAYPLRIRCGVDMVGISNWVTFLENTQAYRRALRRVEYGDERDPEMRAYLHRISPLTQVASIRRPLLVLQGANDPRVPRSESDQMVRALRERKDGGGGGQPAKQPHGRSSPTGGGKNTVWYAVAADEGHGFAKKSNAEYAIALRAHFFRHCLAQGSVVATEPTVAR
jgi:dipeptidyl aminopeptidase/acylaminoacyl peptidase